MGICRWLFVPCFVAVVCCGPGFCVLLVGLLVAYVRFVYLCDRIYLWVCYFFYRCVVSGRCFVCL